MGPRLTVVVVVFCGPDYLVRCLRALAQQADAPESEIIVACDARVGDLSRFRAEFPQVCFLTAEGDRTPAELRALGIKSARGPIVALTEDHCTPASDWCARILEAHAHPRAAVGGALEKDADTALNWAVHLCDYSRYMNPVPEGPAGYLTDCNVSYKATALASIAHVWRDEFHETAVNGALQARGESLWLSPRIVVWEQRSLTLGAALRDRYDFGRLFASTRFSAPRTPTRLLYAACSLLLPPVLVARVARNVLSRRRHLKAFVRALPAVVLMTTVWAWGEAVGYLTAMPGATLSPRLRACGDRSRCRQEAGS